MIGASAGGVAAVRSLLRTLPTTLPASLFVVQHLPEAYRGELARMFGEQAQWPAHFATDGEVIVQGTVYLAPAGRNMLVERGRVAVQDSPRESYHRPSINALFRSAALAYGQRVIAVILTGMLEDGAAGAWEVWRRGGTVIVQDPADAQCSQLPEHVISTVRVDYCAPIPEIGRLLINLVTRAPGKASHESGRARLLIVEDERIVAKSLENDLRGLGYDVCGSAMTGEGAVQSAQSLRPDAVLMDIRLAGDVDGTEAAYLIWTRWQIPVIYLTAYADADTLAAIRRTEAYGYVMKPYDPIEVHAAIQIALERREREKIRTA